jgi:tyrosyl-tRNA synthetase
MMWRYYELLTDVQVPDIEKMKREAHPMQAKKELARRIVADFHSAEAGAKAGEDWARQFQKKETPDEVEKVHIRFDDVQWSTSGIRLDRVLVRCGLAASTTEAARSLEQGAVRIGEQVERNPRIQIEALPIDLPIRVGRRLKIAVITK